MTEPASRRNALLGVVALAFAVRALIGVWTAGRGEMEGLAYRYERDAYAMAAGYGFARPLETRPPQIDLLTYEDSLEARGERLSPERVPAKDASLWRPSTLHPPGYAWFLSVVYRVFGNPLLLWAKALQALGDSLACLGVFAIGRRLAGPRVGMRAALAYALFLPVAYLVTSRVADSWMPAFMVATFYAYLRGLETRKVAWFAAAGAILGVACLLRPDFLLYPAFLGLGALVVLPFRRAIAASVVLGAVTLLVMIPWGLRNQRVNGAFNLTTHAGGMTLLESVGQFPNPYGIVFDDDLMHQMALKQGFEGIDDPAADRWFKQRFLTIAKDDPGLIAGQMVRRIPLGIMPLYRWGYDNPDYAGHGFYDQVRRGLTPFQAIVKHPVEILRAYWDRLIFGVIALVLLAANLWAIANPATRKVGILLFLPYLYVLLSHLPFVMGARLFVPVVFAQWIALFLVLEARRKSPPTEIAFS